uniref:Uncharacterized protein n=1 Tax=Arundo donax TaxID=35708 RepID=A0A0A9B6J6_ARUDO
MTRMSAPCCRPECLCTARMSDLNVCARPEF